MPANDEVVEPLDWYRVALASVGDAVIVTDALGRRIVHDVY